MPKGMGSHFNVTLLLGQTVTIPMKALGEGLALPPLVNVTEKEPLGAADVFVQYPKLVFAPTAGAELLMHAIV